jgi:hypothetical protein
MDWYLNKDYSQILSIDKAFWLKSFKDNKLQEVEGLIKKLQKKEENNKLLLLNSFKNHCKYQENLL